MPSSLSTSNRMYFLSLHEYGEDDLLIEEMSGHEAMSQLFEFRLRLLSVRDDIDPTLIIAKPAVLRVETWDSSHMNGERHWNGVVSRFQRTGLAHSAEGEDLYAYECDIVPWFWFMTQHEDCRIFQHKSVREIIETIFDEFEYSDFRFDLHETHPTLEYCTQYQETTFAFISRLLEREGIHYYFRHNEEGGESRHILVFTDSNGSNPPLEPATLPFHHAGAAAEFDAVLTLARDQQMRTRKVTLGEWDYIAKRQLREDTPTMLQIGSDFDLERYRYPGAYPTALIGKHRSQVVMEAEEASHMQYRGNSQVRTLAPGHTFTLEDHPFDSFNIEYMVLSVRHHGRNNLNDGDAPATYANEFTLLPHDITWRAPLVTPKGLVRGPQTALVTGPSGEEIHTDEHGRIKIQFHWDRLGQYDDRSSCWVRVAQMWAGNGYGAQFIPRIGMEVVVDFLEGDPDQPIVTGCVYNGVNRPPLQVPDLATQSGIKTLSSKGGGGFNELRFEDKKGDEEIFVHAQKNLQVRTGNSRSESIGNNSDLTIGSNRAESVGNNHSSTVGNNQAISIGATRETTIGQDDMFTVGSNQHTTVGMNAALTVGTAYDINAGSNMMLTAGANIEANGGVNIVLQAGVTISLKAGGSSVVIGPAGVQITGAMVMINSGGSPLPAKKALKAEKPDKPEKAKEAGKSTAGAVVNPIQQLQAVALRVAALAASPFCAECQHAREQLERMGAMQ